MQKRKHIVLYLLTPFLIQWVISFLVEVIAINVLPDASAYAAELTVVIALLILPVAGAIYQRDLKQEKWGEGIPVDKKDILYIICLGMCSCIFMNVLLTFLNVHELSTNYQNVEASIYQSSIFVQLLGMGVIAPAMEEMIYRGLLYRRMRTMVPALPAILVSALLFGIMHGNLVQFIFASVLGTLLAAVYEKYKKVSIPILMHVVINITSLGMSWINLM